MGLSDFVLARWYGGKRWGFLYPLVGLSEIFYTKAMAYRTRRFLRGRCARVKLPVSVVSVGNITVGGTGKTALAVYLARGFAERGFSPSVLTHGYFSRVEGVARLDSSSGRLDFRTYGDEPILMAEALNGIPVWVGRDRASSGRSAVEAGSDVLILDDGFQHLRLWRDVDIVCFNAHVGVGNGSLLPCGPMREQMTSLGRADAVAYIGGGDGASEVSAVAAEHGLFGPIRASYVARGFRNVRTGELVGLDEFGFSRVGAFCGIAVPYGFFEALEGMGLGLVWRKVFRDHHVYRASELLRAVGEAESAGAEAVVTTQKDGVKISPEWLNGRRLDVWELVVELSVESEKELWEWLLGRLGKRGA